jgi:hypothetical protein
LGQPLHDENNGEYLTQPSKTPPEEIEANLDELQQVPDNVAADNGGRGELMSGRKLAMAIGVVCILAVASVAPALTYSLMTSSHQNCMFLIFIFFQKNFFRFSATTANTTVITTSFPNTTSTTCEYSCFS